jgi:excisionase family DNA binding protein
MRTKRLFLLQQKQMELKANALRDASRHSTTVNAIAFHEGPKPTTVLSLQECLAECRRALTVKDISDLFSIDDETVYEQAKKGTIPSFRIGTAVRFDPKAISDWLKQQWREMAKQKRAGNPNRPLPWTASVFRAERSQISIGDS